MSLNDQPSSSSAVSVSPKDTPEEVDKKAAPAASETLQPPKDQSNISNNNNELRKSGKSKKVKKSTSKREPDADIAKTSDKEKEKDKTASDLRCSFGSSESTICDKFDDTRDFVVWEFLNEQGIWKPYDPLICRLIEHQKGKTAVVRLRRVDPKMYNIVIDFRAMQQIRLDTSSCRPVRRSVYPYDHVTLCQNIMWDWLCESGGWSRYDIDTCAYIEVAKMRKRKTVDLYKCNYLPYVINLANMVQVKKDTGFKRRVRRIQLTNSFPREGEECVEVPGLNDSNTNVYASISSIKTAAATSGAAAASKAKAEKPVPELPTTSNEVTIVPAASEELTVHAICEHDDSSMPDPTEITTAAVICSTTTRSEDNETQQNLEVSSIGSGSAVVKEEACCSSEVTIELNDVVDSSLPGDRPAVKSDGDAVQDAAVADSTETQETSSSPVSESTHGTVTQSCPSAVEAVPAAESGVVSVPTSTVSTLNEQDDNDVTDADSSMFSSQFAYIQHVFMAPSNVSHLITRAFAHFTALMLAPIVPVLPRTPPIPIYVPPLSSRRNTRPVEGIRKPCSPKKSRQYSQQMEIVLKKFSRRCKKPPEDDCPICMMPLNEFSSFVVNENFSAGNMQLDSQIYQLKECQHVFHKTCVEELYKNGNKDGSLQCPTCKHVYGVMCGTQPPGSMNFYVIPFSLPGYPECETIQIVYNISGGIQGLEHPCPGKEYTARGFPRKCYLPYNEQGRKILSLLVVAWERRLIFTVGRSATSGEDNTVIWNDIHHKTEFGSNTTGHGYPDPFYFSNVMSELYAKNITEDLSVLTTTATAATNSSSSNTNTNNNNSSRDSISGDQSSGSAVTISADATNPSSGQGQIHNNSYTTSTLQVGPSSSSHKIDNSGNKKYNNSGKNYENNSSNSNTTVSASNSSPSCSSSAIPNGPLPFSLTLNSPTKGEEEASTSSACTTPVQFADVTACGEISQEFSADITVS